MTIAEYRKEAYERHQALLDTLADFLDALDSYEKSLFGIKESEDER